MNPNAIELLRQTASLLSLGLEVFNQAAAAMNRLQQINTGPDVTDAELDALKAERNAALDRLAKSIGR